MSRARSVRLLLGVIAGAVATLAICLLAAPWGGPCRPLRHFLVEFVEVALLERERPRPPRAKEPLPAAARFVAHGGGEVAGVFLSNSRQALDSNFERGFRLFEVDCNWTRDGALVLVHDWHESVARLFAQRPGRPTLEQFRSWRMVRGLSQLAAEDAMAWLAAHPEARFVTDVKEGNLRALRLLVSRFPGLQGQLLPQIYRFAEYRPVRAMGFAEVILTLYAKNYSDAAVVEFARRHEVWAITMPAERARGELPRRLAALGCRVFAHTVNEAPWVEALTANGVDGFYTDSLAPPPPAGGGGEAAPGRRADRD